MDLKSKKVPASSANDNRQEVHRDELINIL